MQTDVRVGKKPFLAGEDLTGKEDLLVVLTHDAGTAEVKLPSDITDTSLFILVDGGADAENVACQPLNPNENVRLILKGTCNPGDRLVLADPSTPADAGMVRALPSDPGTYRVLAFAEESGVDGQLILARPDSQGNVTVT